MKYIKLNGVVFPYEEPAYRDTNSLVTGKDLWISYTSLSEKLQEKIAASGMVSVQSLAEARVLQQHPQYDTFTVYGTRPAGYWKEVKAQVPKTLFWALNKQPRSLTLFTNNMTGLGNDTGQYNQYSIVQFCLLHGVTVQVVYPETYYSVAIPPLYNKKKDSLFSKVFIAEKLWRQHCENALPEEYQACIQEIHKKALILDQIRSEKNAVLMTQLYEYLQEYREEWAENNLLTLPERIAYATEATAQQILSVYNTQFEIPSHTQLSITDIKNSLPQILEYINRYAPVFGLDVRTIDTSIGMHTVPEHWRMYKRSPKQALRNIIRKQLSRQTDTLNKILEAYIQLDWYMSQEHPEEFITDDYFRCECGEFIRKTTTHYWSPTSNELYDISVVQLCAGEIAPVIKCSGCGRLYDTAEYGSVNLESERIDTVSGRLITPWSVYEE